MGSVQETRKLFTPLRIGDMHLSHRIIMSPLTRKRCPAGIPTPLVAEYYAQRATEGGLIISEGMHPSVMVCLSPSSSSKTRFEAESVQGRQYAWNTRHVHTRAHPCLESGYRYCSREEGVYGLSIVACKSPVHSLQVLG
jgi:hypothetical protein